MHDENAEVAKVQSLQRIRKFVVYAALALLILSIFQRDIPMFVYGRVVLWAAAGVLSILEGLSLKKLGHKATGAWTNAAIYFAVALFPLLARR